MVLIFTQRWSVCALLFSVSFASCSPSPRREADNLCPDGDYSSNPACCVLHSIREDLQENLFDGGECNAAVRKSLRLAFHDAIGYSPNQGGGGADGSIITFSAIELTHLANQGLVNIVATLKHYVKKYEPLMSAGDFIQFAAAVGTSNCPGAPRLDFLFGRPDAKEASPDGLVPNPSSDADAILARMADAGFTPEEVVALMASHSIATSNIDPTVPGTPLDSTPSHFDTQFYVETMLRGTGYPGSGRSPAEASSALPGVLRLQSDFALSRDLRTSCTWQSHALDLSLTQDKFKAAMRKLSVVGQNASNLIDCSEAIAESEFRSADKVESRWFRKSDRSSDEPNSGPMLPAGKTMDDLEQTCPVPFPMLDIQLGPVVPVSPVEL